MIDGLTELYAYFNQIELSEYIDGIGSSIIVTCFGNEWYDFYQQVNIIGLYVFIKKVVFHRNL